MRLICFCLQGFRGYLRKTCIRLNDLTTIIGRNDAGKSTILEAMDTFFNGIKMDAGDYNINLNGTKEIRLTAIFDNLPSEVVIDETNPINLSEEFLLNSDGYLEIEKVFKGATPTHKETYIVANHPSNENMKDLLKLKIGELKKRAKDLGIDLSDVNQTVKSEIRRKIWSSTSLEFEKQHILVKDEDTKKIGERLESIFPTYSLFKSDRPSTDQDSEAQDPMQVAIKEAMKAQEKRLKVIARRVQREVEAVANRTVEKLKEMDLELAKELNPVFKTDWNKVFKLSLTSDEQIPINKRGSGVRRLILLNFFRVKAEQQNAGRNVIYAIEEPETSQHPDNQKMLIQAFWELSQKNGTQVFFTTHTPMLTNYVDDRNIRYIVDNEIHNELTDEMKEEIAKNLGVLPDHKVKLFIGVEGPNDIEGLKNFSKIICSGNPELVDLEQLEEEGKIVFIPFGGSSFKLWINRLNGLNVPELHICDRDNEPPKDAHYQDVVDELVAQDKEAYITTRRELENYIHPDAICSYYADQGHTITLTLFSEFDDVPMIVAKALHEVSESQKSWDELQDDRKKSKVSSCKKKLNSEAIKRMTYDQYSEIDSEKEIESWIRAINKYII